MPNNSLNITQSARKKFAEEIVVHCAPRKPFSNEVLSCQGLSGLYAEWDGNDTVSRLDGAKMSIRRVASKGNACFVIDRFRAKLPRVCGVINEICSLGRSMAIRLDMEDSRKFGMPECPNPCEPLIAYNRRQQARNVSLWPLPRYHEIGNEDYAQPRSTDPIPFEAKLDRVGWRGNLAGRSNLLFPERGAIGRPSHVILEDLTGLDPDDPKGVCLVEELRGISRFRAVEAHFGKPDLDLAFALRPRFASLETGSVLAPYCDEFRPRDWFHRFRYILCLSGYDTGSNFFNAAMSNSLIFKEDDGWELFYTASFRPWEHYVPIEPGATDLPEKLDWARSHQNECARMAKASQKAAILFADAGVRLGVLNGILDCCGK